MILSDIYLILSEQGNRQIDFRSTSGWHGGNGDVSEEWRRKDLHGGVAAGWSFDHDWMRDKHGLCRSTRLAQKTRVLSSLVLETAELSVLVSNQLDRQFHSRANQAGALQQRRGRGGGSQGAHKKQKRLNGVSKCFFFFRPKLGTCGFNLVVNVGTRQGNSNNFDTHKGLTRFGKDTKLRNWQLFVGRIEVLIDFRFYQWTFWIRVELYDLRSPRFRTGLTSQAFACWKGSGGLDARGRWQRRRLHRFQGWMDLKSQYFRWWLHSGISEMMQTLAPKNRVQSLLLEPFTSSKAWYQEFLAMMRGQGGGKPVGSSTTHYCVSDKTGTKWPLKKGYWGDLDKHEWHSLLLRWSHFLRKARLKQGRGKWKVGVFSRRIFQAVILQRFEFSTTFGLKLSVWKLQPNTISFDGRFCVDYYPFNLEQRVWPRPNLRAT